jgi:hypothetical protein
MNNYEQQAIDFLETTNTTFEVEFVRNGKYFDDDKQVRDIYKITLTRGSRSYTFEFGQSIMNSQYIQDTIPERTYSLDGISRTGRYSINDIAKYQSSGQKLILIKGKVPTAYDVLANLITTNPGSFEDFCSEYGYDVDSRKAEKTYNNVCKEWLNIQILWNDDELEELGEIQ